MTADGLLLVALGAMIGAIATAWYFLASAASERERNKGRMVVRLTKREHYWIGVILLRYMADFSKNMPVPPTNDTIEELKHLARLVDAFGVQTHEPK